MAQLGFGLWEETPQHKSGTPEAEHLVQAHQLNANAFGFQCICPSQRLVPH